MGNDLGNWFKDSYYLKDVIDRREVSVLNLKVVMLHFKEFVESKTDIGAFNNYLHVW